VFLPVPNLPIKPRQYSLQVSKCARRMRAQRTERRMSFLITARTKLTEASERHERAGSGRSRGPWDTALQETA
jgi:hypothetical protein